MSIDMAKANAVSEEILAKLRQTHGEENVHACLPGAMNIVEHGTINVDETGMYFVTVPGSGEVLMVEQSNCECAQFANVRVCQHTLALRIYIATEPEVKPAEASATRAARPKQQPQQQRQQRRQQQSRQETQPKSSTALVVPADVRIEPAARFHMEALPVEISTMLLGQPGIIRPTLPPDIKPGQFVEAAMRSLRALNDKGDLMRASPDSIVHALTEAVARGHLPGRDCHLVVLQGKMERWDDYRGLQRSLMRCPVVRDTYSEVVRFNDIFDHDIAAGTISHKLPLGAGARSTQPIFGYYAIIVFRDGYRRFKLMTEDEVQAHAETLPSYKNTKSAWHTHPIPMKKKTVMLALCRSVQQVEGAYPDDEFSGAAMFADLPDGDPVGADQAISNLWG